MNVDLVITVKLLHRVFGFLAGQSAAQLRDIADGRTGLALAGEAVPEKVPPQSVPRPAPSPRPVVPAVDADYTAIVERLRSFDSVQEGAAYLGDIRPGGKRVTKVGLLKIGAEMGLVLREKDTVDQLRQRLVNHAIGARKKYAGLQKW
ncbi:MAG TPA: hypothetical protein VN408_24840 [Actinoplanes sp.]|nr:hypothetical protein [Actinoplanes sp.]